MADQASQPTDSATGTNGTFVAIADAEPHDLLGELARAMHQAARSQSERMNAELERQQAEQLEAIGARASADIEDLKAGSEADIGGIDAWAKAETEKIKLERLRRIDARRERLAGDLERQERIKEREIVAIQAAIEGHRSEVDRFFGRLEHETDPAAIARVASTLPAFPALDEIAESARQAATTEFGTAETGDAAALTKAASTPPVPVANVTPEADATSEAAAAARAEPGPDADSAGIPVEADADATVSESRLMGVMDPDTSHGAAAETPPWEAPYAVSVAAGTAGTAPPEAKEHLEPTSRVGATLLRTVRAIRPMGGDRHDRGGDS